MPITASILAARNLTKSLDSGSHRVEILRGIDLEIPAGQFVAIMGASGSGKSTLLGLLAGLDTATSGTIVIDGVDITGLSEDKLALVRGRKIGFVFQSYQLLPTLTAEENVLLPHELAGGDVSAGVERARSCSKAWAWATASITTRSSSLEANSSEWRSRALLWSSRPF